MKKDEFLALAVQSGFKLDWAISKCTGQFESFYHAAIAHYKDSLLNEVGEPVGLVTFVDGECYAELSDTAKLVEFDELFTSDQLAAAILKATGPLGEEVERLKAEADQHYVEQVLSPIRRLLTVARCAEFLADGVMNDGDGLHIMSESDFDALSKALDALDELPDDKPGYTLSGAAKAAWALRDLVGVQMMQLTDGERIARDLCEAESPIDNIIEVDPTDVARRIDESFAELRAKLAAAQKEVERLKTVPMKYRRMAFNAQLQDENNELRARLAKAEQQVAEWQPIETAPKDEAVFLAWRKHATHPLMVRYEPSYDWFANYDGEHVYDLTHWMPLPKPPAMAQGEKK